MKTVTILLLLLTIAITSCQSNTYDEAAGIVLNPTYTANVEPIMNERCIEFHSPSTDSQPPFLLTYDQVKNACANGVLLCRINGTACGEMMPLGSPLPHASIDIINRWAEQGFPN